MVLANWETYDTFLTSASLKTSMQMSLVAGKINSSPVMKGFLALTMQLATKNDALSADAFNDVVAFKNCFCYLFSCFIFKNLQRLVF